MPIYEYECKNQSCKHQWDELQSIKAEPIEHCPKCVEPTAKRLISASNFVLSGGGWAKDLYSK